MSDDLRQAVVAVSIHAPARGATAGETYTIRIWGVSIHAPARGATDRLLGVLEGFLVSIHAPARGATFTATLCPAGQHCFNSRTRKGCDEQEAIAICAEILFQFTHPQGVRR